jgi:hypothetical protein
LKQDLKVFWRLVRINLNLWTNINLSINSSQLAIIFRILWKLIILLFFLFVVVTIVVWWDMENIPLPPYDLLEHSHVLLEHILVFHHKENLGLFSAQAPIQVLAYGCLEGLSKTVYTAVTKSCILLQHCYCTSSSFG